MLAGILPASPIENNQKQKNAIHISESLVFFHKHNMISYRWCFFHLSAHGLSVKEKETQVYGEMKNRFFCTQTEKIIFLSPFLSSQVPV